MTSGCSAKSRDRSGSEGYSESLKALKAIPKEDFAKCFDDWKIRWHKCIAMEGDYFEGDEIDLEQ